MVTGVYRSRCKTVRAALKKSLSYTPKAFSLGVSTIDLATHALLGIVITVAVRIDGVVNELSNCIVVAEADSQK